MGYRYYKAPGGSSMTKKRYKSTLKSNKIRSDTDAIYLNRDKCQGACPTMSPELYTNLQG